MAHIRIDGDRISVVSFKDLDRVIFSSTANVTPFRIQYQGYAKVLDVGDGFSQFRFCCAGGVMGDLGFVAAGKVQGCIDNGLVEGKDRFFFPSDF